MYCLRPLFTSITFLIFIVRSLASGSHSDDNKCYASGDDDGYDENYSDVDILQIIYSKCGGRRWPKENRTNWDSNMNVCFWSGVTCAASDDDGGESLVTALDLSYHRLSCTLPSEVFNLRRLTTLDVSNNPRMTVNLSGIIYANCLETLEMSATGTKSLSGIEYAPSLDYLRISNNYLPNALKEMGNLAVSYLYMENCRAKGEIPDNFFGNIEDDYDDHIFMDISNNYLTGTLPYAFSRFSDLYLTADDNFFTGIDPSLCNMTDWNDGMVEKYGCDALMCPMGTYNDFGRRYGSSGIACEKCRRATYYGSIECRKKTMLGSGSHPLQKLVVLSAGLTIAVVLVKKLWVVLNKNFDFEQHAGLYS